MRQRWVSLREKQEDDENQPLGDPAPIEDGINIFLIHSLNDNYFKNVSLLFLITSFFHLPCFKINYVIIMSKLVTKVSCWLIHSHRMFKIYMIFIAHNKFMYILSNVVKCSCTGIECF